MDTTELKSSTAASSGSGENAGLGAAASTSGQSTAASSEICQPSGNQSMPQTSPKSGRAKVEITPDVAAQLLYSAIAYCQQAGLTVRAGNSAAGGLGVLVYGLHWCDAAPDKIQVGPPPVLNLDA